MTLFSDRRYVILTAAEVGDMSESDYAKTLFDKESHLPVNRDGTKYIVKYKGGKPSFLSGKDVLTLAEIREEMTKSEWLSDPPPEE